MPQSAPVTLWTRFRYGGLFLVCVVGFVLSQILADVFTRFLMGPASPPATFNIVFRPLALAFLLIIFGAMAKLMDRTSASFLESQGLGLAGRWKNDCLLGMLLGATLVALCVAVVALLGRYRAELLPVEGMALRLGGILWVGLTAAALEEVAFRGYPFQTLIRAIGPLGATLLLAVLFGFIHLANPHASATGFTTTALVSVLLSLAYLRTGRLWMPIGVHFAWNFTLGTLFGLPVSGVDLFAVVVKARADGPLWLTGGDYGIEASLTGTVAILVGTAGVYLLTRPKRVMDTGTSVSN